MKHLGTLLALLLLLISCKDGNKNSYNPASIGAINTVSVVMDDALWKGKVGDKVRAYFAAPAVGLTWEEPLYSIHQIPQKVFTGTSRNSRSILYVSLDTVNVAHVKKNLYATPQRVGVVKGKTEEELIELLEKNSNDIIDAFRNMEIKEAQDRFTRSLNKDKALQEKFGISLALPSIYKVGKQEDNFVWIDREIPKGTMNIVVYTLPEESFNNDSTFIKDIVRMRDSIGKLFIPGPDVPGKTTHMRTEPAFAPYVYPTEIAGKKAVEVRGIWDIKNYPMAGPFLTYIIDDKANNRKLILEGFVFAPATQKRDDIFELEAILRTVTFK